MSRPQFSDAAELLRDRDFAKLFSAHLVAWFGTSMAPIAMAFGVLHVTGSARDTGVVIACQTAAQIAVLLFGGVVADRVSRRRVMVSADVLAMSSQATMAIAFVTDHAHVPLMMALMVCNGVALAFHQPALVGFIPQVVKPEKLQAANALLGTARSGAFALGAACAGILVALFGSGPTIAIDAAGFGIAAVLVSRIGVSAAAQARTSSLIDDLKSGWREVRLAPMVVGDRAAVLADRRGGAECVRLDRSRPLQKHRWADHRTGVSSAPRSESAR